MFPEKFSGELGENVFRFKVKFLQALLDSQVREKDKVEVLRKHLTGKGKILIGSHYTDIDKALQSLIDYFCKPEWDGLGCFELYKLRSLQERNEWLCKFRLCMKCGGIAKLNSN